MKRHAFIFAAAIASSMLAAPSIAAERMVKAETRAVFIGADDVETAAKEFKTDLNGPTDFILRDKAWERLTEACTGGLPARLGAQTSIFSIDGLIGFFAEKIVKFFRARIEAALDASLKKYAHSYEAPAELLVDPEFPLIGEPRQPATLRRSFSLYEGVPDGGQSPALAVKCFRITKTERIVEEGKVDGDAAARPEGGKKLVADFIGIVEPSSENPFQLVVRPLRLIYVKPTAKTSIKTSKLRDGTTKRERPMTVAINLSLGGSWREDNRIEQNAKLFDLVALSEKFSLEELERDGYVERWYDDPKTSKKKVAATALPPSSKVGDDIFADNSVRAIVTVTESGYEPRYLKSLKKYFDKFGDDAEKEGVKRVKDALGDLLEE